MPRLALTKEFVEDLFTDLLALREKAEFQGLIRIKTDMSPEVRYAVARKNEIWGKRNLDMWDRSSLGELYRVLQLEMDLIYGL